MGFDEDDEITSKSPSQLRRRFTIVKAQLCRCCCFVSVGSQKWRSFSSVSRQPMIFWFLVVYIQVCSSSKVAVLSFISGRSNMSAIVFASQLPDYRYKIFPSQDATQKVGFLLQRVSRKKVKMRTCRNMTTAKEKLFKDQ